MHSVVLSDANIRPRIHMQSTRKSGEGGGLSGSEVKMDGIG